MKVLRLPAVTAKTGRRKQAIYEDMAAGTFPRPIKLSAKAVGWLEHEIDAWIKERIAERDRAA
jgi:prophage regulatory protein